LDTLAAAWRQNSSVSTLYERFANEQSLPFQKNFAIPRQEGYDPYDDVQDFADDPEALRALMRAESPEELQFLKNRVRQERSDRQTIADAGGWGLASALAAGITDPILLASMAIPVAPGIAGASRVARVGAGVAGQAALDTAAEAVLHSGQELRTVGESAFNVGAGVLLSSVLGGIATRIPKGDLDGARRALQAEIARANGVEMPSRAAPVTAPAQGMVRMYHGGSPEAVDGPLWFTSSLNDAQGWAARSPGMKLWYVDVPESTLGGDLANGIAPQTRMELPAEIAGQRKPLVNQAAEGTDSFGAARVVDSSLEDEGIARGGQTLARTLGKVSVLTRTLQKPFKSARVLAQRMVEVPYLLQKNTKGKATPVSVELAAKRLVQIGRRQATNLLDEAFLEFKRSGGTLSRKEFSAEVANALDNGDVSPIPQVAKVAQWARKTFDEDKAFLKQHGIEFGDEVVGAKSYFPRVYNFEKIMANMPDFRARLFHWYKQNPKIKVTKGADGEEIREAIILEDAEITDAVDDTVNRILGLPTARAELNLRSKTAPMKARVLDVPNAILSPYLERDFEAVMSGYFRGMAPEIEVRRAGFSSPEMVAEFQEVTDEFKRLRAKAGDDAKKVQQLTDEYTEAMEDLTRMRDRLFGNVGPRGTGRHVNWIRLGRTLRTWNYVRLLGSQTLSSMSDVHKLVARYGLAKTMTGTAKFLTNWNLNNLTRENSHRIGAALQHIVDTRTQTMAEIGEEMPRTRYEKGLEWASNKFSRLSLMSQWNSTIQHLTTLLEQDEIVRAATRQRPIDKARLAEVGFEADEVEKIKQLTAAHGEDVGGITRMRTELWSDQELARKVEMSILKVADQMITVKGFGDLPMVMDSEIGKTLLQFRSFAMASVNRTMIPLAQGFANGDTARAAQGVATALALGAMTYYAKEFAAGRKPKDLETEEGKMRLLAEALSWSGMLGYIPDLWDPIAASSGEDEEGKSHLPRFSRFESRSPWESALGPTVGTGTTFVANTVNDLLTGGVTAKDITHLRRMMPYQNIFYWRQLVNAIEGEAAEMIDAEGATTMDFADRLTHLEPSK
jgi:hypothetical protein